MGWFGPKLKPGERVVLRSPSARWQWVLALFQLCLAPTIWLALIVTWRAPTTFLMVLPTVLGVLSGVGHFMRFRWNIIVTDRRLLVRSGEGWRRREVEIVPIERIDCLRASAGRSGFEILYGDKVHAVEPGFSKLHQIHKALGLADEPGRIYETKLKRVLAPGETVVARRPWEYSRGWWAVTDRRFLYCLPSCYVEEMKLENIQEVEHQAYVPKITLRGDGREIEFHCFDDEAEKIVRALGHEPAAVLA